MFIDILIKPVIDQFSEYHDRISNPEPLMRAIAADMEAAILIEPSRN